MHEIEMEYVNYEGNIASAEDIAGYRHGKVMWLRKSDAINLLDHYFHEIGHVLGDVMSFRNGDVMTPYEVKLGRVEFTLEKLGRIHELLFAKSFPKNSGETQEIINYANKILTIFTKGRFKPGMIRLHNDLSQSELLRTIRKHGGANTIRFTSKNTIDYVDGRNERNSEMSSYICEIACLRLHENAIRLYSRSYTIIKNPPPSPAHRRAFNIVQRAYERNGWILPSLADLRQDLEKTIHS